MSSSRLCVCVCSTHILHVLYVKSKIEKLLVGYPGRRKFSKLFYYIILLLHV